jgi:DNA mismatch endonuclease Vsr
MDTLTTSERSERMRRIRSKDTEPELTVRRLLHSLNYRYTLHAPALPGRPDIVFTRRRKVILVHGCFWHQHDGCTISHIPKSRQAYWTAKLNANRSRDLANQAQLAESGWTLLTIWECQTKDLEWLKGRLIEFLE